MMRDENADLDEPDEDALRVEAARAERERRLDEVAEHGTPAEAEPDLLVSVPGYVPVYNPTPYPLELPGGGESYRLRPEGVGLVGEIAVQINLGEGYCPTNKPLSRMGVRALRQPSDIYEEVAKKGGFTSVVAWVMDQNRQIVEEARSAWEAAQHEMNVPAMTAVVNAVNSALTQG